MCCHVRPVTLLCLILKCGIQGSGCLYALMCTVALQVKDQHAQLTVPYLPFNQSLWLS